MIEALGRTGMREPGIGMPAPLPTGTIGRLRETAGTKLTIVARVSCGEHAVFCRRILEKQPVHFPSRGLCTTGPLSL